MASEATRLHQTAPSLRDGEMSTGKNADDGDRAIEWMVGTAVILVLVSTVLTPVFIGISGTDRGTFGDQFGVVNALFSGLAAVFTVATLQLQRQAMVAQREDVRAQLQHQNQLFRQEQEQQKKREQTTRSLELAEEWNTTLLEARIAAQRYLDKIKEDTIDFASLESIIVQPTTQNRSEHLNPDEQGARGIFRVLRFLEKWSNMQSADLVDKSVTDVLLKAGMRYWKHVFVPKLVSSMQTANDPSQHPYADVIRLIDKHMNGLCLPAG